jgi:hypothetical protein
LDNFQCYGGALSNDACNRSRQHWSLVALCWACVEKQKGWTADSADERHQVDRKMRDRKIELEVEDGNRENSAGMNGY